MVDGWQPTAPLLHILAVIAMACLTVSLPIQIIGAIAAALLLLQVGGVKELTVIGGAVVLGVVVCAVAPLFDTAGSTVLFSPFGRPYALEALMRGALTGALMVNMMLWFACLGSLVGGDGLLRCCGKAAPRIGMVTSLVVQMVPRLFRRASRIRAARKGAALTGAGATLSARVREGCAVFATVAADSLERSVVCADAMESRGYGTGPRSDAAGSPLSTGERAFGALTVLVVMGMVALAALGDTGILASGQVALWILPLYGLLTFLPVLANLMEDFSWLF